MLAVRGHRQGSLLVVGSDGSSCLHLWSSPATKTGTTMSVMLDIVEWSLCVRGVCVCVCVHVCWCTCVCV